MENGWFPLAHLEYLLEWVLYLADCKQGFMLFFLFHVFVVVFHEII